MKILSIETSCDDSGIAIVEKKNSKITTLASVVSSQDEIHKKWGGVYPAEAKREHQKNLVPSFKEALKRADLLKDGFVKEPKEIQKILERESVLLEDLRSFFSQNKIEKIDAIAVTVGPGLEPCLWVGVNFAKALSLYLNLPIIPVNHIKAHLLFFLKEKSEINYPALGLIVSGGHTELVLMSSNDSYKLIGKTKDDAAGECFDKAARILGLGYPGGATLAKHAKVWASEKRAPLFNITLPRPMKHTANYDFSFSGLKTAILYDFKKRDEKTQKDKNYIQEMCYETERAIVDVLTFKLKKAIEDFEIRTVVLGGGVTANDSLREKIQEMKQKSYQKIEFFVPPFSLSTDNGEMIAIAATAEKSRETAETLKPNANMKIYDKLNE